MGMAVVLLSSCSPTKRLAEGEVFLKKQNIQVEEAPEEYDISNYKLESLLKQRTNRKILFFRFHLWVHNRINSRKQIKSRLRKKYRIEKKIQKRIAKGEDLGPRQIREMRSDTITWRDWLSETVGEKPVSLDEELMLKSELNLETYLSKHGYFRNQVWTEIDTTRNGKKASVIYHLKPNRPFKIDTIKYQFDDPELASRLSFIRETSELKEGDVFDIDALDDERDRIQNYLTDKGYFSFSKEYVTYLADSTVGDHEVGIRMIMAPLGKESIEDSLVIRSHQKFFIGDIYYHTSYYPSVLGYAAGDTLMDSGSFFLFNESLDIKPDLLLYLTTITKGDVYMKSRITDTYRRLSTLSMFRSVNIQMKERLSDGQNVLDCHIYLTPAKKFATSFESGVTHRDGLFGLSGSLVFRDRNVFKRSENGQLRIVGAIETTQPLTLVEVDGDVQSEVTENLRFNTFEFGPELEVKFNHWFPFGLNKFNKSNQPKSSLSFAFNYQDRPDYERRLTRLKYGLNFIENEAKGSHFFGFAELSTINISKSEAFQNLLDVLNDDFLTNSYQNHLIGSLRGVWENRHQTTSRSRTTSYNRTSVEVAGLLTRLAFNLADDWGWQGAELDETGSYQIGGIRFAEYIKIDQDYRWYFKFDEKNTTAFRINGGVGIPLKNLGALPFDKSYFAGGSNGLRAWDPRTLGPGSFRDTTNEVTFNNVGEMKLLTSLEYRFKITQSLEGAMFVDAGNIWFVNNNETRPGGTFEFESFIEQIAVGAGMGLRFDFDFFLIRFDVAAQMRDPSKATGERWLWQPKDEYNSFLQDLPGAGRSEFRPVLNYNLGIGYPF